MDKLKDSDSNNVAHALFGDLDERDRRRRESRLTVSMDGGSTAYLFDSSVKNAKIIFKENHSELNFEEQRNLHSPAAGTTIDLIITGLTVGAGIAAGEFLKELGKDLWKSFKGIMQKPETQINATHKNIGDSISITLHIDGSSVKTEITGLGAGDEKQVKEFLTENIPSMYQDALGILGERSICEGCVEFSKSVDEIPCRYCTDQGGKLKLTENEILDLKGNNVVDKIDPSNRKRSFFKDSTEK